MKILFLCINPYLIQNFSCPKNFCHHRHAVWQGIYYFPLIDGSLFATPSEDVRYLLRTRWRFGVTRQTVINKLQKESTISWNVHLFNVFTEHVPVHKQDRNIKGDHFHLEGIGAPQLLKEFINLYRCYFLNSRGFKFKMSLPSQSSPSRNYTSPFSGVVLLSRSVTGLQNSPLNRVECTFSTIPTCAYLPGGVSFLSVYHRIYRCTTGTSPDCCSFLHFPYGFLALFS